MSASDQPKFTLVEEAHEAYAILRDVKDRFHPHLSEARVSLMWAHAFKPDRDGNVTWGQVKKVSPLEQQYHDHDFVILLNAGVWQELSPEHRRALVDHELNHCGASTNDEGDVTYYLVKHDLEEFVSVVRRYGLWRAEIEDMVNAAIARRADDATPVATGGQGTA